MICLSRIWIICVNILVYILIKLYVLKKIMLCPIRTSTTLAELAQLPPLTLDPEPQTANPQP